MLDVKCAFLFQTKFRHRSIRWAGLNVQRQTFNAKFQKEGSFAGRDDRMDL
jgi:hypothetical protein